MQSVSVHRPVLLNEIIRYLVVESLLFRQESISNKSSQNKLSRLTDEIWYLDCTLGGGGHAVGIADTVSKYGKSLTGIIALDQDQIAIERAKNILKDKTDQLIIECENFRNLDKVLMKNSIESVDFILLDLGISSDELDNSGKGFTFQKDEPLLMTMGDPIKYPFTAKDIVNGWDEEVIANIIFGYAEERFARRIARAISGYRQKKIIETSAELAEIIKNAVPVFYRRGKIHPATKTFQALRIAVNDELGALREGLKKGFDVLKEGGRMAVISFHSLEDRIVKDFYKGKEKEANIITKRPIVATDQEVIENPRSRSAKLRVIEKYLKIN